MGSDGTSKRMRAVFAGRVQGVGFRYMVCHAAEPFAVTGFVRNLWDGDVEVIAEGPLQELSGLLDAIKGSRLGRNIYGWNGARRRMSLTILGFCFDEICNFRRHSRQP